MTNNSPVRLQLIPIDRLPSMIGRPIHLRGCHPGCVWILKEIQGDLMLLETPKTKRPMSSHVNNACYTRYWERKVEAPRE